MNVNSLFALELGDVREDSNGNGKCAAAQQ
jgi:hypothetical protein